MKYVIGDATQPQGDGLKLIAHVCNDLGLWGSGFVMAISNRWELPANEYKRWAHGTDDWFCLGEVQIVSVENDIDVVNMVAQRGVRGPGYPKPLQYDALDDCLWVLDAYADDMQASVHMPRIGCGLAGGKWEDVEKLISRYQYLDSNTTVYDLS